VRPGVLDLGLEKTKVTDRLITVRADEKVAAIAALTMPGIRAYAARCKANLMVLDGTRDAEWPKCDDGGPHYRILELGELLSAYPRILNLDVDIIVRRDCPDLFEVVPPHMIGSVREDVGSRADNRGHRMRDIQLKFQDVGWTEGYVNTGVFLVGHYHRHVFDACCGQYYSGPGSDDVHLGYQIARLRHEVCWLDPQFNFMTPFAEPPNRPEHRFNACVAEGSLVLTSNGLKPIERVLKNDKLWDGLQWVRHTGLIYKGIRNVITYSGLTATPDHEVWTEDGWRTFESCRRLGIGISQTGIGGQHIRVGRNYFSYCSYPPNRLQKGAWLKQKRLCLHKMHTLWNRKMGSTRQSQARYIQGLSCMSSAKEVSTLVVESSCPRTAALSESQQSILERLRQARHQVQLSIGCGSLHMGHRKLGSIGSKLGYRPNRQRRSLRTWKLQMVYQPSEFFAQEMYSTRGQAAKVSSTISPCDLPRCDASQAIREGFDSKANRIALANEQEGLQMPVWDIANAGPLRRFTVQGLLVHNCIIHYAGVGVFDDGVKDKVEQIESDLELIETLEGPP
jgi:hypothetical protein